jgi:SulP family sulfate permease
MRKRSPELFPKLWDCFRQGYTFSIFRKDLIAGVTVGIVALPLAMAFGIASGVTPAQGLYTAIIAGFLISFLGGSRHQIGGPTGAFVIIIYEIIQNQGYEGLVVATFVAAIILVIMGLCKLGSWIKYIPFPLITGFTSGIAVIIFSSQIKGFFGLQMETPPADFIEKWMAYFQNFQTFNPSTLLVGTGTLALILFFRRFTPVIPWGIASIVIITSICSLLGVNVETIHSRFGDLPRNLPFPSFQHIAVKFHALHELLPDAFVIAFLAGIESLLSAVVADGMTGAKHKSNCELVAQGIANLGSICFGGIPATGAIARTATNVKSGARTPVSGMIHAITLFLIIVFFAPIVSQIPLAALAAVLVMVSWNMCEIDNFLHLLKAPKGDVIVLLVTFLLTILVDLTVAVEIGMVLAALMFMKRMSDSSSAITIGKIFHKEISEHPESEDEEILARKHIPKGVEIYEINGPLFFGIADRMKEVLHGMEYPPKVFILRMRKVPVIDATGLHALRELYLKCKKEKTVFLLSNVQKDPLKSMKKYGLKSLIGKEHIFANIREALAYSRKLVED